MVNDEPTRADERQIGYGVTSQDVPPRAQDHLQSTSPEHFGRFSLKGFQEAMARRRAQAEHDWWNEEDAA